MCMYLIKFGVFLVVYQKVKMLIHIHVMSLYSNNKGTPRSVWMPKTVIPIFWSRVVPVHYLKDYRICLMCIFFGSCAIILEKG